MRAGALERGDEIFERAPVLAIVLTPSWVAGIHHVRTGVYLLTNGIGAAVWAAGIGLAAYWVGPAVIDFVGDLGLVTGIGLVALIAAGVVIEIQRRRRRRFERADEDDEPAGEPKAADPPRTSAGTAPPDPRRSTG
jgi:membrane protein DedA with SNARE-associated domain